jgi:hypothetical protein
MQSLDPGACCNYVDLQDQSENYGLYWSFLLVHHKISQPILLCWRTCFAFFPNAFPDTPIWSIFFPICFYKVDAYALVVMEANLRSERRDPPCWQKLFETGERVLCKLEISSHTDFFAISKTNSKPNRSEMYSDLANLRWTWCFDVWINWNLLGSPVRCSFATQHRRGTPDTDLQIYLVMTRPGACTIPCGQMETLIHLRAAK